MLQGKRAYPFTGKVKKIVFHQRNILLLFIHLYSLFQEDSLSLLTVIKGTCKYRRSRRYDFASDFLPPSKGELDFALQELLR